MSHFWALVVAGLPRSVAADFLRRLRSKVVGLKLQLVFADGYFKGFGAGKRCAGDVNVPF